MRSPGQSRVCTSARMKTVSGLSLVLNCCLLGVVIFLPVTVLHLKLSVSQPEEKTTWTLEVNVKNLHNQSDDMQATATSKIPVKKWRDSLLCGPRYPAEDGSPAECNPDSYNPCCSLHGWCDRTPEHCDCVGCIDYRKRRTP
ncbi:uncharacterized protein [Branchiostoma lanceolatum]|uniref:uncharacterized protein n=1 Tax=Branchiostoma lanceolatum TaxID=7740 RepID=UPI0034543745